MCQWWSCPDQEVNLMNDHICSSKQLMYQRDIDNYYCPPILVEEMESQRV
jgi:hypothetical protein